MIYHTSNYRRLRAEPSKPIHFSKESSICMLKNTSSNERLRPCLRDSTGNTKNPTCNGCVLTHVANWDLIMLARGQHDVRCPARALTDKQGHFPICEDWRRKMTFNDTAELVPFRANIFVDWLNIKKHGGRDLDFSKLMSLIRSKGGLICRANIYLPEANGGQQSLYDALRRTGFKLVIIPESQNKGPNCDTRMIVDMVTESENVDTVYLISNDSDFVPAVQYLQSQGKRVLLIHADKPSNRLRNIVDEWRHLGQLKILREDWGKSTRRGA